MFSLLFFNFLRALIFVLDAVLTLYFYVVIISALLSWVNPDPYNPIVRILRNLTEPLYYQIRRYLPFIVVGGLDLSPIVVLLLIKASQIIVIGTLSAWMTQAGVNTIY